MVPALAVAQAGWEALLWKPFGMGTMEDEGLKAQRKQKFMEFKLQGPSCTQAPAEPYFIFIKVWMFFLPTFFFLFFLKSHFF